MNNNGEPMADETFFLYLFQPFAHYRNPFTWNHPRTTPLPHPTMVIGMLQRLVGDYYGHSRSHNWNKLKMAILGSHSSKFDNYTRLYKGDKFFIDGSGKRCLHDSKKGKRIINGPPGLSADASPQYFEELFNVHLLIFLRDNSSNLIAGIEEALNKNHPNLYLGRAEDVVYIRKEGWITKADLTIPKEWERFYGAANYGMWIKKPAEKLTLSRYHAHYLPLWTQYIIEKGEKRRAPNNRADLFFHRKKLIRENYWHTLYYIPPRSSVWFPEWMNIEILKVEDPEVKNYFGENTFIIPDLAWVGGERNDLG